MKKTVSNLREIFTGRLEASYEASEIQAVFREVARFLWGFEKHEVFLKRDEVVAEKSWDHALDLLTRLENGEPVQHLTGSTEFAGLEIEVSPAALIPRPETEELVEQIVLRFSRTKSLDILDIGTGTGCIALALKSKCNYWTITGIDISLQALQLARRNARKLNLEIDFEACDIHEYFRSEPFDVIVSNPPYIAVEEKPSLQKQVVNYEPGIALFAPPGDELYFYKLIANQSLELLKPGGTLCFEIHNQKATDVVGVLTKNKFKNIEVITDLSGNDRMIIAEK